MKPVWLDAGLVRALHAELLAEYGGLDARCDEALLESALARPQQQYACGDPASTLSGLAAAYGFGLARNHGFSDGNKRIALAVMDVFLQLNGYEIDAPETEAVIAIQELASGRFDEAALAAWLKARCKKVRKRRESAGKHCARHLAKRAPSIQISISGRSAMRWNCSLHGARNLCNWKRFSA